MRGRYRLLVAVLCVLALVGLALAACPSDWPVDDDDSADPADDDTIEDDDTWS